MIAEKLISVLKQINYKQLAIKWEKCDLCGCNVQLKLNNNEMAIRCTKCFATPVSQMMGLVFKQHLKTGTKKVYELSSRGSFVRFLKKQKFDLTLSELFNSVDYGSHHNGILCQNVEKLTFEDNSFDICTSLEVFEHVENDIKGFKEIYRVLKSGGIYIFTVPINLESKTIERTRIVDGRRQNILPPEYHSDSIRGVNQIFCYRNYGHDILKKLYNTGFQNCKVIKPPKSKSFGFGRPVIIASKL